MNDTPTPTPRTEKVWKKGGGLHSMDFHARTLERELTAAREELKAVTEQRDRLAEALREIEVIRWLCDGKVIATEALQSLNQPEP
jgi:hypothetical protein